MGPYVLANLLRCPVYMLYCFHDGEHYRVELELFEDQFKIPRNNRQQVYARATQKFARSLEKQVARFPLQWFNFFYFWGDQNE
jgi:predicted LPLAT superfamily acyltransferase